MKAPKGTRDLLPAETRLFQEIEQRALAHFGRYGFREIRTPIFEETALFQRGIGDDTDVVQKEMYTFEDKGGRSITLRPEMTAAVCRAVMQHNLLAQSDLVRLLYRGPMFRYERPQAGRFRQFHQLGIEVFGNDDPLIDAETIQALMAFLAPYNLPNLTLVINSVGDHNDRPAYLKYLQESFGAVADQLCNDCQGRYQRNVLRVLDCKHPDCKGRTMALRPIAAFWNQENREHFEAVCRILDGFGIAYQIDHKLVRGLDYYTKTAFELQSGELGAQSAVMGGGRYDGLAKALGGPDIPGFGWAMGLDRLVSILEKHGTDAEPGPDLFFVFGQKAWLEELLPFICELREAGLDVAYDLRVGSFKSQMKRAGKAEARYVAILGDEEYSDGSVSLKNMQEHSQERISRAQLLEKVRG